MPATWQPKAQGTAVPSSEPADGGPGAAMPPLKRQFTWVNTVCHKWAVDAEPSGNPAGVLLLKPRRKHHTWEEIEVDAKAAAEAKVAKVAEKQAKLEQAITWLASLYQPVNVVNMTPCPTDNNFKVCKAHQLSQVGSMLTVKGKTPTYPFCECQMCCDPQWQWQHPPPHSFQMC